MDADKINLQSLEDRIQAELEDSLDEELEQELGDDLLARLPAGTGELPPRPTASTAIATFPSCCACSAS